ncbi:MAG: exodeoxyribonuclease VII large subunit [Myxococcota bacterium]|nr:exodeoxyribonuclease VII large subunit [Myxococcota bacterium]
MTSAPSVAEPADVHSVSQLARRVRASLEGVFDSVWVKGELSNFRAYGSGHWYFTLKDDQSQLKAAMFARDNRRVTFRPKDGDEVLVRGRVDLYARRGDLQIVAAHLEPLGAGKLHQEFERLKARLGEEGLFDQERKQPLPAVPRRIGIVTSEKAAALQDMLRVLDGRDPSLAITLAPARVQGDGSGAMIAAAIDLLNRASDVEVILCGRGGGSMEDLWAFNEEVVARAIARSRIPIISGVGHEIDFTIADFVADARAPTPTAAAEMAVPVRAELEAVIADRSLRMVSAFRRGMQRRHDRVEDLGLRLRAASPRRRLDARSQRLDDASQRLRLAMLRGVEVRRERLRRGSLRLDAAGPARGLPVLRGRFEDLQGRLERALGLDLVRRRERLELSRRALGVLGPLQSLDRGYSITSPEGGQQVLRDAAEVAVGEDVRVRLARGALRCTVVETLVGEDIDLHGRSRG